MLTDLLPVSRALRRSPASGAAAILTLSLTLGVGAAIFAVVAGVVLTPPPFVDPGSIVVAGETPIDQPAAAPRAVSYATFEAWRQRTSPLAALEAIDGTNLTLTGLDAAERVTASDVTPGFLRLLGVAPARGRSFGPDDVAQPVVIVSHEFWQRKLAGAADVVGRQIVLGGRRHAIVGVLPERFLFALEPGDIWRPFQVRPAEAARAGARVRVVARLAEGVSPAQLTAALDAVSRSAAVPVRAVAIELATATAGDARRILGLVGAAASVAMLIAFVNLTGLLIVRAVDRQRELAVRSALGARIADVARLLVIEAGVIGAAGAAGGALLAWWLTPAAARLAIEQFGAVANREAIVNWRAIAVVSGAAVVCACACGLLPALLTSRRSLVDVLRRRGSAVPRELMLRRLLVGAELALAFVLLVSMTLLGRSLLTVLAVNPGFDPDAVVTASLSLPAASYESDARVATFYTALQAGLDDRLGPGSASLVDELPLTGDRGRRLVGRRSTDSGSEAVVRVAAPGYFDVMRIPLVAGRTFDAGDDASVGARVVVGRRLAERLFGTEPPVGRQIWLAGAASAAQVIGVVGDVSHRALDEAPLETVYLAAAQAPSRSSRIVVRSADATQVVAVVRDVVARLDPDLPAYRIQSLREIVDGSPGMPSRRLLTATFVGFAALAVALGAIGLFGLVAHDVARRRGELALRIALGATGPRILRATLRPGGLIVGGGLIAGGVISMWTARVLSGTGFAPARIDWLSIAGPAALLAVIALVATLPAARRATRIDPLTALRGD